MFFPPAAAAAKSLQLYPTLCNTIDSSPPGSPIPGILQARTLEWVATAFSNAWKWKVKVKSLSHVWLLATPWTAAHQAPPSMGFSRQKYWSGVPLPSPFSLLLKIKWKARQSLTKLSFTVLRWQWSDWWLVYSHHAFLSLKSTLSHLESEYENNHLRLCNRLYRFSRIFDTILSH